MVTSVGFGAALVEWWRRYQGATGSGVPCFYRAESSLSVNMFDPLHQWLGIAPIDQPPDHYRLLGLTRFESNPDVIDAAADRHLAFLHGMINGPHAKDAEELSNRISTVRLCLLSDTKRHAYDESLRAAEKPDPTTGWMLSHGDGKHHGPFDWTQIHLAAQQGRYSNSTHLFHAGETRGQWVLASTLLTIPTVVAEAQPAPRVSPSTNASPDQTPTFVPRTIPSRRSKSNFGLKQLFMLVAVPGAILFAALYFLIRNPEQHSQLGNMVLDAVKSPFSEGTGDQFDPSVEAPANPMMPTVGTSENTFNDGSQKNQGSTKNAASDKVQPNSPTSSSTPSMTGPSSSLPSKDQTELDEAFLSMNKTATSPTISGSPTSRSIDPSKIREVKIELTKSRSAEKVGNCKVGDKLQISAVQGGPAKYEIIPANGELKFGPITKVVFPELYGLTLNCSLQRDSDDSIEFVCKPEWSYVGNRLAPFTITRIEKLDKEAEDIMKQRSLALEKAKLEETQAKEAGTKAEQGSLTSRARYAAQQRILTATKQRNAIEFEYDMFKTQYDSWKIVHQTILDMQADGRVVLEVSP